MKKGYNQRKKRRRQRWKLPINQLSSRMWKRSLLTSRSSFCAMKIWGRSTAKRFLPGAAKRLGSRWKTTGKFSAAAATQAMSPPTTKGTGWRLMTCIWPRPFRERASARQCCARLSRRPCRRTRPLTSTSLSATRARCASTAGWALRWCRRFQTPAISWSTAAGCQERKEKAPPQSGEAFCVGFTGCSICPCTVPSGRAPKRTPASL